jgi:hypothetical protein
VDGADVAQPHNGIILTLSPAIARRRAISPPLILPTTIPPVVAVISATTILPISLAAEAATILRETILQDFLNILAMHPVNVDEWNLMNFHTVLRLLAPHTDDQTALIKLFEVATPA